MKFYTSDLHFDHSNMLEYEHRPWANVESMNETMVDWCDEYLYRLGGVDLSKIEVDGKIAGPKTDYKRKKGHPKLKKFWHKTWHIALSFLLGVAITTVVHVLSNQRVRTTAEAVCTVFGRDEQECKDGIDDVLDMADQNTGNYLPNGE